MWLWNSCLWFSSKNFLSTSVIAWQLARRKKAIEAHIVTGVAFKKNCI